MRRGVIAALLAIGSALLVASVVAASASTSRTSVSPSKGGRTTKFVVSFIAPDAARTQGALSRMYTVAANEQMAAGDGQGGGSTCASSISSEVTHAAAHSRVHVTLSPKATGRRDWCKGTFKGHISEISRPLCEPVHAQPRACPLFMDVKKNIGSFTFRIH